MKACAAVTLREITAANEAAVRELDVWPHQREFVEPNDRSLEEARSRSDLRPFAIYAGEELVGFLLLRETPEAPEPGRFELWRLMIGAQHQRRGFGRRAVEALIAALRERPGAAELRVSYLLEDGHPGPFYAALGFEETGERIGYPGDPLGHEAVMRLPLR